MDVDRKHPILRSQWLKAARARSRLLLGDGYWTQDRIDHVLEVMEGKKEWTQSKQARPVPLDISALVRQLHPGLRIYFVSPSDCSHKGASLLEFAEESQTWLTWEYPQLVSLVSGLIRMEDQSTTEKAIRKQDATLKEIFRTASFRGGVLNDIDASPDRLQDKDGRVVWIGKDQSQHKVGDLIPHDIAYPMVRRLAFRHDPEAGCPLMDGTCMPVWTQGDEDYASYLYRLAAICLLPHNLENLVLYNKGLGSNGKSTWADTLLFMLGDYAMPCDVDSFLHSGNAEEMRHSIADMPGHRLVNMSDMSNDARLRAGKLKSLSGDAETTIRRIYEPSRRAKVTFTLAFFGNVSPVLADSQRAWLRRLRILPWRAKLLDRPDAKEIKEGTAKQANPDLKEELQKEWAGIFNRILEQLRYYYEEGESIPRVVEEATRKYFIENGTMEQGFIEDALIEADTSLTGEELWENYKWHLVMHKLLDTTFGVGGSRKPENPKQHQYDKFMRALGRYTDSMVKKDGRWIMEGYAIAPEYIRRVRAEMDKPEDVPSHAEYGVSKQVHPVVQEQQDADEDKKTSQPAADEDIPW